MTTYALIKDNKIWELAEFDSIEGRFPAEMEWLDVSGQDLKEGLCYDRASGTFHESADAPQLADLTQALQERLDAFARTRGYDGILNACSYAASTNPRFALEGLYCVQARDEMWSTLFAILEAAENGARRLPTSAELMDELPALTWPDY